MLPQGNTVRDGDIANPEGSISELCACWRWKRRQGRGCVLLLNRWLEKGWVLPQGMLKPGCYFWCVLGPQAVVQAAAGRGLGVAPLNVQDGQGLLCGDFFQVWAWPRGVTQGRESSRLYLVQMR